ncbi:MAG: type II secretion system protein [Patescibacteria group bacterium]
MRDQRGSLLLEAIIATGISATFGVAILQLALLSTESSVRIEQRGDANFAAQQGIEALQTISFADLTNVTNGKVTFTSTGPGAERWSIAAGSETLWNGMTRTVSVEDVYRDASCEVVTSGGTIDPDSKELVSIVAWLDSAGRSQTVAYRRHRTRYEDPQGDCFAPSAAGQVSFAVDESEFYGGKQLRDLYFTNTGSTSVTIATIMFTWDNSATLDQIFIDNGKVWSDAGPGTPSGVQPSGVTLDIQDFTMTPGQTSQLNKGQFSSAMGGATLTMTVTFTDGSVFTSDPFMPE